MSIYLIGFDVKDGELKVAKKSDLKIITLKEFLSTGKHECVNFMSHAASTIGESIRFSSIRNGVTAYNEFVNILRDHGCHLLINDNTQKITDIGTGNEY